MAACLWLTVSKNIETQQQHNGLYKMKTIERLEIIDTVLTNAAFQYNSMIDNIETLNEALELIDILSSEIGEAQKQLENII